MRSRLRTLILRVVSILAFIGEYANRGLMLLGFGSTCWVVYEGSEFPYGNLALIAWGGLLHLRDMKV